ncbi:MAG: TonB-dependent receptor [Candidatus Aureabacteria bacterium]|nr:TonB-dependent receptor [Candidatus Auribacterota bacterium]
MKKRNLFTDLLAIYLLLAGGFASAQEEEGLEALLFMEIPKVITSTMTEKDPFNAPSTITVITEMEIKSKGLRTLSELLNKVPGIEVYKNTYGVNIVTLRGIAPGVVNDKFKFMVNGHTLMEPVFGGSEFYDIGLENIQQVEIIRGPGSCLYGTNAFAGIINIITKKPSDLDGGSADVKIESFNAMRANIQYGKGATNWDLGINANYSKTDGPENTLEQDILYGTGLSYAPNEMKNGATKMLLDLNYRYKDWNLDASYTDTEFDFPVPQMGALTEDGENSTLKFFFIESNYHFSLTDNMIVKTKLSYDRYSSDDDFQVLPDHYTMGMDIDGDGYIEYWPEGVHGNYTYKSEEYRGEIMLDIRSSDTNEILLGVFFEQVKTSDIGNSANGHPLYFISYPVTVDWSEIAPWIIPETRRISGVFLQDEWTISDNWYLILGGRYDKFNDFGSTFNPRCGLVWTFNNKGDIFKLMYGTAFKSPSFSQLYDRNNPFIIGNPNLDPETLTSIEASVNYIFAEKLQTFLSVYNLKTRDLIDLSNDRDYTQPTFPRYYINYGKTNVWGTEFEMRFNFAEKNYVYGSYAYTKGEDEQLDIDLPRIPKNQFTFGLNLHKGIFNWDINMDYTGEMPREAGDPREEISSTTVFDTTFRFDNIQDKGWNIYFSVYNITDEEIYAPASLTDYPLADQLVSARQYSVGVSKKF